MSSGDWVLGVDVGTSRSAGAIARSASSSPNGSVTSLEVDGNRWIASMVLLDPSGQLVVGAAADHQAAIYPDRVERTPKRYLGGRTPLLLGGVPVPVTAALAKLIRVFADEGRLRNGGRAPAQVVLTHPVRWGADRRAALEAASAEAGYPAPVLVPEPVAAAVHYADESIEVGDHIGVYDLGGGTFDTAVLRRTEDSFESVGAPGGDEFIGGEHFDHLIYEQLGELLAAEDPELWEQMQFGEDRRWTRAAADLLTQARRGKEAVSAYPSTQLLLPVLERDVVVTREQVEALITPLIERTIDEMAATISSAGLTPAGLKALYLVGGSSRIPLVTRLMTARFGDRVATRDEPKSVVALGAALIARRLTDPRLRGATGRYLPVWRQEVGDPVATVVADEHRLAITGAGRVTLCAADGRVHWSAALAGPPTCPAALGPGQLAVGCGPTLVVLGDRGGNVQWTAGVRGRITIPPLFAESLILAGDDRGAVTAMQARDGRVVWILPVNRPIAAPLVPAGNSVLIAATGGLVYRADVTTGVVAWGFPATAEVAGLAATSPSTTAVVCTDGVVFAVDTATGVARWRSSVPPVPAPAPAGTAQGGTAPQIRSRVDGTGVRAAADGLLVADNTGTVTCFDMSNGQHRWSARAAGGAPHPAAAVGLGVNRVVAHVGSPGGVLAAVELASGLVLARQRISATPLGQPTLIGDLVVTAAGGRVEGWRLSS